MEKQAYQFDIHWIDERKESFVVIAVNYEIAKQKIKNRCQDVCPTMNYDIYGKYTPLRIIT